MAKTRAMEQLHITHAAERRRFGERNLQSPSRFIDEIPSDLLEVLGRAAAGRHGGSGGQGASFDYSYSQESFDEGDEVRPGMRVRHPVFGDGVIMEVQGSGINQKLKIDVDSSERIMVAEDFLAAVKYLLNLCLLYTSDAADE